MTRPSLPLVVGRISVSNAMSKATRIHSASLPATQLATGRGNIDGHYAARLAGHERRQVDVVVSVLIGRFAFDRDGFRLG